MIRRTNGWSTAAIIWSALLLAVQIAAEARPGAQQNSAAAASPAFFETRVRPVLAANCYDCHAEHAADDNVFTQFYSVLTSAREKHLAKGAATK